MGKIWPSWGLYLSLLRPLGRKVLSSASARPLPPPPRLEKTEKRATSVGVGVLSGCASYNTAPHNAQREGRHATPVIGLVHFETPLPAVQQAGRQVHMASTSAPATDDLRKRHSYVVPLHSLTRDDDA